MNDQLTGISNSEMQLWARCPRKWLIFYYFGLVPTRFNPVNKAELGTRVHTALEGWHGYGLDPVITLALLYKLAIDEYPEAEADLRKEHDMTRVMVEGYAEWLTETGLGSEWRVVATEAELAVPIPGVEGAALRMKMDQVVQELITGWLYFLDFKTAANFDRPALIRLDPQMRAYSVGQHMAVGVPFGAEPPPGVPVVAGGVVRTLRRVKRTARSEPPYYDHCQFRYPPEVLGATLQKIQRLAGEIMTARAALDHMGAMRLVTEVGHDQELLYAFNGFQRWALRPVQVLHDCAWSCPLVDGPCEAMDSGEDWPGMLISSGRYVVGDPYAHYHRGGIAGIRDQLARLSG